MNSSLRIKLKMGTIPVRKYNANHLAIIEAEIPLYRSGPRREGIRLRSRAILHNLPQFYASWQVAAMYSSVGSYFYTYRVAQRLPLLYVTMEFIQFLLDQYDHIATEKDKERVRRFLYVFGYKLDVLFTKVTPVHRTKDLRDVGYPRGLDVPDTPDAYFIAWANHLMSKDPHIHIRSEYLSTFNRFNRISLTSIDYTVFEEIFNVTHPPIVSILRQTIRGESIALQGIYVPPIISGMFNTQYPLMADDIFPEEVFIRKSAVEHFVKNTEGEPYAYTTDETDITVLNAFSQRPPVDIAPMSEHIFFNDMSLPAVAYIFLYTHIYSRLFNLIINSIQHVTNLTEGKSNSYASISERVGKMLYDEIHQILIMCGNVIDAMLVIDAHMIHLDRVPVEENNPYYKDGEFNANLYTYSVLSSAIKMSIGQLRALYTLMLDQEILGGNYSPVISGGALFGVYTTGMFRRLTKDADVKIVLEGDVADNGNEYELMQNSEYLERLGRQENDHWALTVANYIWLTVNEYIFNELAGKKLYVYARVINAIGRMKIQVRDYSNNENGIEPLKWGVYASATPNKRNLTNTVVEFDRFIELEFQLGPSFISTIFNWWLEINKPSIDGEEITSYVDYNSAIKKSLHAKKAARAAGRSVATYNKKIQRIMALFETNEDLHSILKSNLIHYKGYTLDKNAAAVTDMIMKYDSFFEYNRNLNGFLTNRPAPFFRNGTSYAIGGFASLYIHKAGDETDPVLTYGLIDYTFDTHYSTLGAFTRYAGIRDWGVRNIMGIFYGSSFWFIHETIKLNTICNETAYPGDNEADENPLNACAPKRVAREIKSAKYGERYRMVNDFFIAYIIHLLDNKGSSLNRRLLEGVERPVDMGLPAIEEYLTRAYSTPVLQIEFDRELITFIDTYNNINREYMVGAGRHAARQRRRRSRKVGLRNQRRKQTRRR